MSGRGRDRGGVIPTTVEKSKRTCGVSEDPVIGGVNLRGANMSVSSRPKAPTFHVTLLQTPFKVGPKTPCRGYEPSMPLEFLPQTVCIATRKPARERGYIKIISSHQTGGKGGYCVPVNDDIGTGAERARLTTIRKIEIERVHGTTEGDASKRGRSSRTRAGELMNGGSGAVYNASSSGEVGQPLDQSLMSGATATPHFIWPRERRQSLWTARSRSSPALEEQMPLVIDGGKAAKMTNVIVMALGWNKTNRIARTVVRVRARCMERDRHWAKKCRREGRKKTEMGTKHKNRELRRLAPKHDPSAQQGSVHTYGTKKGRVKKASEKTWLRLIGGKSWRKGSSKWKGCGITTGLPQMKAAKNANLATRDREEKVAGDASQSAKSAPRSTVVVQCARIPRATVAAMVPGHW
ncbi:hypothetical protein DL93DRAFT_2093205 [Clavulina sp. PMI_390]|nr:hypothetical protein DL93DRAFT_2093205 [Clavulina sp. PMI_390]